MSPEENQERRITLRMDTSTLVQEIKCPSFANFVSTQSLKKKHVSTAYMDRGTVMHGLLQRYYHKLSDGESPHSAMNFGVSQVNDLKKGMELKDEDYKLLIMRFCDYFVKYNSDKIQVLRLGDTPALEVGFSVPILDTPTHYFVLEGRIDMITEMSEQLVIWDHKAQGRKYFLYGHSLQALNYCLAIQLQTGTPVRRFMYNYVRLHQKVQPDTFDRKLTFVPQWLLERWHQKLISYFYAVAASRSLGRFIDRSFPNPSCSDIGFGKVCPFTKVCELPQEFLREQAIRLDYEMRQPWQPWSLDEIEGDEAA